MDVDTKRNPAPVASLPLDSEVKTARMLAALLSEELGFSPRRAGSEADIVWAELEEKLGRTD